MCRGCTCANHDQNDQFASCASELMPPTHDEGFPELDWTATMPRAKKRQYSRRILGVCSERRPQSLKPRALEEWKYMGAILDSGASVTVILLFVGNGYDVVPSDASKAGVKYEVAKTIKKSRTSKINECPCRGLLARTQSTGCDVNWPAARAIRYTPREGEERSTRDWSGWGASRNLNNIR